MYMLKKDLKLRNNYLAPPLCKALRDTALKQADQVPVFRNVYSSLGDWQYVDKEAWNVLGGGVIFYRRQTKGKRVENDRAAILIKLL